MISTWALFSAFGSSETPSNPLPQNFLSVKWEGKKKNMGFLTVSSMIMSKYLYITLSDSYITLFIKDMVAFP
jgi:hypothetical protein